MDLIVFMLLIMGIVKIFSFIKNQIVKIIDTITKEMFSYNVPTNKQEKKKTKQFKKHSIGVIYLN